MQGFKFVDKTTRKTTLLLRHCINLVVFAGEEKLMRSKYINGRKKQVRQKKPVINIINNFF